MDLIKYALELFEKTCKEYEADKMYPLIRIPVEFSGRLQTKGGYFKYDRFGPVKIVINKRMMLENGKEFVDEVLLHEMAHWFVFLEHGRNVQSHGREWKAMMRRLGRDPKRCHDYDRVGAAKNNRFDYDVNGQTISVGPRQHKRIQDGYTGYRTRTCKTGITASMWCDYKEERTQELPNGFVSVRPPKATKPKAKRKVKGKTKANIVRGLIKDYKALGFTMPRARASKKVIEEVMAIAELSETMAKRYIKNLW